jgi:hypothetical protein
VEVDIKGRPFEVKDVATAIGDISKDVFQQPFPGASGSGRFKAANANKPLFAGKTAEAAASRIV